MSLKTTNQHVAELEDRISQLEGERTELQRMVQIKDQSLVLINVSVRAAERAIREESFISADRNIREALLDCTSGLETTPTNLPKFVTEEEYLRVKEGARDDRNMLELCQESYVLLKSHAEAMALAIENYYEISRPYDAVELFRKDFPKPTPPYSI